MRFTARTSSALAGAALVLSAAAAVSAADYDMNGMKDVPGSSANTTRMVPNSFSADAETNVSSDTEVTLNGYRSQRDRAEDGMFPEEFTTDFYLDGADLAAMINSQVSPEKMIREIFERLGTEAEHVIYDNDELDESQIDFQALVSHECFDPVNHEVLRCLELFGPYYNLKAALLDGSLRDILITTNPDATPGIQEIFNYVERQVTEMQDRANGLSLSAQQERDLRNAATAEADILITAADTDDGVPFDLSAETRVNLRSRFVWEVCASKYETWAEVSACHQRNDRLVTDTDLGLHIESDNIGEYID